MGGQAQSAGANMANGNSVFNCAVNSFVPSTASNAQYLVANSSSRPVNGAPQGMIVVANGDTQGLGSSGIANRLPHGAQLYVSFKSSLGSSDEIYLGLMNTSLTLGNFSPADRFKIQTLAVSNQPA